jgi:hypothetical protein
MCPVTQKNGCSVPLRLQNDITLVWAMSKLFKWPQSLGRWSYQEWPSYAVIVVCSNVGMIPEEAILIFDRESVGEVTARRYGILWSRISNKDVNYRQIFKD